jgi:TATA-binding protein-associated factor Taf7
MKDVHWNKGLDRHNVFAKHDCCQMLAEMRHVEDG